MPSSIIDTMLHYSSDQYKQESNANDLCDSNFENDFNVAIVGARIERRHINSGCVNSNIDDGK